MTAPSPGGSEGRVRVVLAEPGHAPAVTAFIQRVWTPSASVASVRAGWEEAASANVAEPGVPPPVFLALREQEVLGYLSTIPTRLWDGSRSWPAYWLKGLMVLPEFRNGPIGYALLKAAAARLPRSAGLAAAPAARRLFAALGYADLGAIPNLIRPLDGARLSRWLSEGGFPAEIGGRLAGAARAAARWPRTLSVSGGLATGALRGAAWAMRQPSGGATARILDAAAPLAELDQLWESVKFALHSGVVRDGRYLTSWYSVGGESPYRWVASRRRGALTGVAVLRCPIGDGDAKWRGLRLATLVELVADAGDRASGLALLASIESEARRIGADAIVASASAPGLLRLLQWQCYLPFGGNVHLLLRDTTQESRFGRTLDEWWLTRGDGHADDGL